MHGNPLVHKTVKLIIGRGRGLQNGNGVWGEGGGGASEFLPLQRGGGGGGGESFLAMLDWGHKKLWVVLTREFEVLPILKGRKKLPPFKRGRGTFYTVLRGRGGGGRGRNKFQTHDFPILLDLKNHFLFSHAHFC